MCSIIESGLGTKRDGISASWLGLFCVLTLVAGFYFVTSPIGLHTDEARDLNAYIMAAQGSIIYRDVWWLYGPLTPYLYGMGLRLFGYELLYLRLMSVCVVLVSVGLTYRLASTMLSPFWSAVAALIGFSLRLPVYNYNHLWLLLGSLALLVFVHHFVFKGHRGYVFLAGCCSGFLLDVRPVPEGVILWLVSLLFLAGFRHVRGSSQLAPSNGWLWFFIGTLITSLPVYGWVFFYVPLKTVFESMFPLSSAVIQVDQTYIPFRLLPYIPDNFWVASSFHDFMQRNWGLRHHNMVTLQTYIALASLVFGYIRLRRDPSDKQVCWFLFLALAYTVLSSYTKWFSQPVFSILLVFWMTQGLEWMKARGWLENPVKWRAWSAVIACFLVMGFIPIRSIMQLLEDRVGLELPTVRGIKVAPSLAQSFQPPVDFIVKHSAPGDRMVRVGQYSGFFPLFTRTTDLFSGHEYLFKRAGIDSYDFRGVRVYKFSHFLIEVREESANQLQQYVVQTIIHYRPKWVVLTSGGDLSTYDHLDGSFARFLKTHYILRQRFIGEPPPNGDIAFNTSIYTLRDE